MLHFFRMGGPFMWIHLILAIVILFLFVKKIIELFIQKVTDTDVLKKGVNAILFWGVFSTVLGFFAHFMGMYMAMQAIQRAADISPAIVAGGYAASLITVLTGLFTLLISALLWFFIRWQANLKLNK